MRTLLEAALSNALVASFLALVVVSICRFPIRPAARHALWLIVLVKFVTPPLFPLVIPSSQEWRGVWKPDRAANPSDVPARNVNRELEASYREPDWQLSLVPKGSIAISAELQAPGPDDALFGEEAPAVLLPRPAETVVPALTAASASSVDEGPTEKPSDSPETPLRLANQIERQSSAINLPVILGTIWISGSLAWFLFAGLRLRAFHRQVARLLPADNELQALADEVAVQLGLKRPPLLRMTDAIVPPMLTLVPNRAVIILPARLMSTLSRQQQSAILAHEMAHVRRGDQWMRWFEFIVVGLYWWHPAVWYARKELQAAEELCCDAWVVRVFPDQARGYAHALLAAVDFLAEVRVPAPAEACTLGPISSLKQRLDMILKRKPFPELTPAAKLALAALAFIILPWAPQLFGQAPAPTAPVVEAPTTTAPLGLPAPVPTDKPGAQNLPALVAAPPTEATAPVVPPTPSVEELPPTATAPQPPLAGNNPIAPPVAPRATQVIPGILPGPRTTTWPIPANYAQTGTTPAAGPQGKSIEERLDRLEKMIEQFVTRGSASPYGGVGAPAATPVNVPVRHLDPIRKRSLYEASLAATDRRIKELEDELSVLKRRKEAFSKVDPNGMSVVVDSNEKAIRALNLSQGTTLWTFSIDNPESVQSATSNGQVVTVRTKDGQTFQLDSKTGRMILGVVPTEPASSSAPGKPAAPTPERREF